MDHYLGVPFDLTEVLFIATANFIQNSRALARPDGSGGFRGYTEREKQDIARSISFRGSSRSTGGADRST